MSLMDQQVFKRKFRCRIVSQSCTLPPCYTWQKALNDLSLLLECCRFSTSGSATYSSITCWHLRASQSNIQSFFKHVQPSNPSGMPFNILHPKKLKSSKALSLVVPPGNSNASPSCIHRCFKHVNLHILWGMLFNALHSWKLTFGSLQLQGAQDWHGFPSGTTRFAPSWICGSPPRLP